MESPAAMEFAKIAAAAGLLNLSRERLAGLSRRLNDWSKRLTKANESRVVVADLRRSDTLQLKRNRRVTGRGAPPVKGESRLAQGQATCACVF